MNILLIAIDTLSARHMGCYGYQRDTSPFLDQVAEENALFESLYCQAIPTQPSFTSLYTGQYAITHGIVAHGTTGRLDKKAPFLATLLQQHGYTTCAVDNLYSHQEWFARGYEFYITPWHKGRYAQATPWEVYNARAVPWLKQHKSEHFFMFVHYWDPHTPYVPPEGYRGLFYEGNPTDPSNHSLDGLCKHPLGEPFKQWFDQHLMPGITDAEYIKAMYDSEIRYVDEGVRRLLETLDELEIADNTLIIIFSDHGEMMYKHGIYFDHHGLYDEDIHVPLIVRWPGVTETGTRIPHLVQHIDIAPTILEIADIAVPQEMEGSSLVPYLTGGCDAPLYPYLVSLECTRQMKWALRGDGYKYILAREEDYRGGPMRELYDLKKDPHEMNNIADQQPEQARELEAILEGWIAQMMAHNGLTEDPLVAHGLTMGSSWKEWVETHGYW